MDREKEVEKLKDLCEKLRRKYNIHDAYAPMDILIEMTEFNKYARLGVMGVLFLKRQSYYFPNWIQTINEFVPETKMEQMIIDMVELSKEREQLLLAIKGVFYFFVPEGMTRDLKEFLHYF